MAKTKAELQSDAEHYRAAIELVRARHSDGLYLEAVEFAMAACSYIDGMMQFERRFQGRDERASVEAIDYVLQYAPLVFDHSSLRTLESVLKSQKRIEKNTTTSLGDRFANAVALMWDAHRLWRILEQENEVPQDKLRTRLGGDQNRWRSIAEKWDSMGLVRRTPDGGSYRLSLVTRITSEVRGKCPSCGAVGKAAMGRFLDEIACPKCRVSSRFILLARDNR